MDRVTELKSELTATIFYGEGIAEKLQNPDLSDKERADNQAEFEAVETKASGLRRDLEQAQADDERELRIKAIGRDMNVQRPEDEQPETAQYRNPFDALFDSPEFKAAREIPSDLRGRNTWSANVEYKVPVDPETANPGDLVQHVRPGIIGPYVYPRRVGPLFAQSGMDGSSVSWLFVDSAEGGADYAGYGTQKPPGGPLTLDVAQIKAAKIATVYTVPDDALDDLPALRGTLQQMLMVGPNGIEQKAEREYIDGSGAGSPLQIKGIEVLSPADVTGSGDNVVKDILAAALDIEADTGIAADAILINPSSVFEVMTLEPTSGDGRPLFNAFGGGYRLPDLGDLGLRWVLTKAVLPGVVYVGAFGSSILYTREAVNIRATNEGIGLADKNLTMFVAETRQALVHPYNGDTYRKITTAS